MITPQFAALGINCGGQWIEMWVRRHFFGRNHPRSLILCVDEWFLAVGTFSCSLLVGGARTYDPFTLN